MALLAALACVTVVALPATAVPAGWTTPRQVLAERFGPAHSTAVDADGFVHVAVEGLTSPGIWYLTNAGGMGWSSLKVTHKPDYHPSIAVFADGRVVIAFDRRATEGGSTSIGVFTVSNRTGTFQVRRRYDGNGKYPSVDAAGNQRFDLVFQGPGHSLLYRRVTDSGTVGSTITAASCCAGTASIDLDAGHPHVLYSERHGAGYTGRLRYAFRIGSAWHTQTIDSHRTRDPEIRIDQGTFEPVYVYVRPASGTWLRAGGVGGFGPVQIAPGYFDPPDVAGRFAVAGNDTRIKLVRIYADPPSAIILAAGFDPEIEVGNGQPRVVFNRASGTTNDGIFFTRRR
jgi:hypothetical protein